LSDAGDLRPDLVRCIFCAVVALGPLVSLLRFCEDTSASSSNDESRLRLDCIEALLRERVSDRVESKSGEAGGLKGGLVSGDD
jgi:hypothetical protein